MSTIEQWRHALFTPVERAQQTRQQQQAFEVQERDKWLSEMKARWSREDKGTSSICLVAPAVLIALVLLLL